MYIFLKLEEQLKEKEEEKSNLNERIDEYKELLTKAEDDADRVSILYNTVWQTLLTFEHFSVGSSSRFIKYNLEVFRNNEFGLTLLAIFNCSTRTCSRTGMIGMYGFYILRCTVS